MLLVTMSFTCRLVLYLYDCFFQPHIGTLEMIELNELICRYLEIAIIFEYLYLFVSRFWLFRLPYTPVPVFLFFFLRDKFFLLLRLKCSGAIVAYCNPELLGSSESECLISRFPQGLLSYSSVSSS